MSGRGNYRPVPEDFAAHCREGSGKLMKRYRASSEVVRRWKSLFGTLRPMGRGVVRIDADGKEKRYETCKEAAIDVICGSVSNIYGAIRTGGTAYGYRWRWDD